MSQKTSARFRYPLPLYPNDGPHAVVDNQIRHWLSRAAFIRSLLSVLFALIGFHPAITKADAGGLPPPLSASTASADITGNWEFIPVPLPDRNVTHILVSRNKSSLFLGTPGGVATYDGVSARAPDFESPEAQQPIYVNALVETNDGAVIVGTINDSLWRWDRDRITAIYGACPRGSGGCPRAEWGLAAKNGKIYVVSSASIPARAEALAALRKALSDPVVAVDATASYLGFAGEQLVAVSNRGSLSLIDEVTGDAGPALDLRLQPSEFVRNVSFSPGIVLIGTDKKCAVVSLSSPNPIVLANGNCTALYMQQDGTAWLSTNALYRHDRSGWLRWSPGQGGVIAAGAIVEDRQGNVWIGSSDGLWRYLDLSREHRFSGERAWVTAIVGDHAGGVVAGLENGEIWRLTLDLQAERINVPIGGDPSTFSYFRGVLLARAPDGGLWALTKAGLFNITDAGAVRVSDYPVPATETHQVPSSLAISSGAKICVGLQWDTRVLCLADGQWVNAGEVLSQNGGSAVAAVGFDKAGNPVAVGTQSISVFSQPEKQDGPFNPTPFGKNHLFGAYLQTSIEGAEAVASGGWGGTVFLRRTADGRLETIHTRQQADQPYIVRQLAEHSELGLLAASDEGLFFWRGPVDTGQWQSMRELDPRLAGALSGVAPSIGRGFWVASGDTVSLIDLPSSKPTIDMRRSPTSGTIATNAVTYNFSMPGLIGLPALKRTTLSYSPSIPNAEFSIHGASSRLDLSDLDDLTTYELAATVTDGFLNTSGPARSQFSISLPFYRNPYKLTGSILALAAFGFLAITRRGPTGFLVRRLGGLKWSTEKSDARFAMEIAEIGSDIVRYELEAPSALTVIRLAADVPAGELNDLPTEVLPYLISVAEGQVRLRRETFAKAMEKAGKVLGETALPESLRFTTSQFDSGAMSLDLAKSLLWLPLELSDDGGGDHLMMRYAIGRTVSSDRLIEGKPPRASELRVSIFAPQVGSENEPLPHVHDEATTVATAARSWGAKVTLIPPDASKQHVLEKLRSSHLFHYAGHAQFIADDAGRSYLPVRNDQIFATDVASALASGPHDLLVAFINGCGSSREENWSRGAEVYGFASAFLNNAAYFIGTQWPIRDEFAASFAKEYYASLFPPAYDLWWRLLRRDPLEGLPFAEALRLARHRVRELSPGAVQTWSSYVFYGDPTRRLVLN